MVIIALHHQAKDVEVGDRKASENIDFAITLMEQHRAELSLATLDTVVFLFRQVIGERQITHPLHNSNMKDFSSALGIRFMYTNQLKDFMDTFALRSKIIQSFNEGQSASSVSVRSLSPNEILAYRRLRPTSSFGTGTTTIQKAWRKWRWEV